MKARYNFWSDIPRNVTRREYEKYQLIVMGTIATSAITAITGFLALFGFNERLRGTNNIPSMTVAEASNYQRGETTELVKLQGFLVAEDKLTMPDDQNLHIIRGRVVLKAEARQGDELIEDTLFEWEKEATKVFLSDGKMRVPIAFDLAKIPMQDDHMARAKVRYVGKSSRTSKPVALEYAEKTYPLSDMFKEKNSIFPRVTRQFFPDGQSVVIFAAVESNPNGGQLIDPLGERLQVIKGTETEIMEEDSNMRIVYAFLSIVMGFSAYRLKKIQEAKWQEFVDRSNQ